jgi:hypothetical protein
MDSLLLDPTTWDLTTDEFGDVATCGDATPTPVTTRGPGYRMAQDVANRCLAWRGEVYYDTTQGVPYDSLLGTANLPLLQSYITTEALKVDPVAAVDASLTFTRGRTRNVSGTIFVSDAQGTTGQVAI